jgi:hypothetical protein
MHLKVNNLTQNVQHNKFEMDVVSDARSLQS